MFSPSYLDKDPVAYVVEKCTQCPDWRSALVRDALGPEVVREWDHPHCPTLPEWQLRRPSRIFWSRWS
ncbi:hypothetical protein BH10ACT10_BH10ACT10_05110 [soil metagenome]